MGGIMVVYFSRSGYTRRAAAALARECDADVDEIHVEHKRHGAFGYLRCLFEALLKRPAKIRPPHHDPGRYDLVVIGTPVWAGTLSSPVRAYLAAHRQQLKRVAFFCTFGGKDAEPALFEMAALCAREPVATLALADGEIDASRSKRLADFAHELKRAPA